MENKHSGEGLEKGNSREKRAEDLVDGLTYEFQEALIKVGNSEGVELCDLHGNLKEINESLRKIFGLSEMTKEE